MSSQNTEKAVPHHLSISVLRGMVEQQRILPAIQFCPPYPHQIQNKRTTLLPMHLT